MGFEKIVSEIYSDYKGIALPFAIAFPAVYVALTFTPEMATLSIFDRAMVSIVMESVLFAVVMAATYFYKWDVKNRGILSAIVVYVGTIIYEIGTLGTTSVLSLFYIFLGGIIVVRLIFLAMQWLIGIVNTSKEVEDIQKGDDNDAGNHTE